MIEKILNFMQKPTETLKDGRVAIHQNYSVNAPKNFALPIERNVLNQRILNKYDFIDFVNEYKGDQTKIFFNENEVKAVFNYPLIDKADHGDSYSVMPLETTKDFKEFENSLENPLSQKQFIRVLKRLEPYIIAFDRKKVDDMDIIEIAENLQATTNINSVQRNAAKAFMLDAEVRAGNSNIKIPRYITFEIPLYKNDLQLKAKFDVELFLDVQDSQFAATLVCYKLDQIVEDTIRELTKQITKGCDEVDSYLV